MVNGTGAENERWRISQNHTLLLDRPHLIGILNVTPDSFSDGGKYETSEVAVDAAFQMMEDGASIVDIGGESTRPGSQPVSEDEQIRRTVPVIQLIRKRVSANELLISIDTTRGRVASECLNAGANIVNDVSACRDDDNMCDVVRENSCGIIIMHRLKLPESDCYSDQYDCSPEYDRGVVEDVKGFLKERCETITSTGIDPESIVIDPGLGFGKSIEQNYELIGRIGEFGELGYSVLSAASRKSFIGAVTQVGVPSKRLSGSLAVSVIHYLAGIRLFRVHDVRAHREALSVASAVGEGVVGAFAQM